MTSSGQACFYQPKLRCQLAMRMPSWRNSSIQVPFAGQFLGSTYPWALGPNFDCWLLWKSSIVIVEKSIQWNFPAILQQSSFSRTKCETKENLHGHISYVLYAYGWLETSLGVTRFIYTRCNKGSVTRGRNSEGANCEQRRFCKNAKKLFFCPCQDVFFCTLTFLLQSLRLHCHLVSGSMASTTSCVTPAQA